MIHLKVYEKDNKSEWDRFVSVSRNATFLFCRDYMEYHADRFEDHSLMFFDNKGRLVAMLPGNIDGDTFFSHAGLTYGGFILAEGATSGIVLEVFDILLKHLQALNRVSKLIYRPVPWIYHRYPCEEDLYTLFRFGATLCERKISSVVPMNNPYPFSSLRMRKVKKAHKHAFSIVQDDCFADFWPLLEKNLQTKHAAKPVHSLTEISSLKAIFPENIRLYRVLSGQTTVAGCVLYVSSMVAHVQYISTSEMGRESGALDYLFLYLMSSEYKDVSFFDFGTSVEQGGYILNEGLIFQKEGFGGRGVVYDSYQLVF